MEYQIEINDTIGYWECSHYYLKQQLAKYKDQPVNVKISSLGGDANEGLKIYQLFKDHGNVTAYLYGFVASAATIIALGCKKTKVGKNSLYLIHNCLNWVDTWGMMNKEEIHDAISDLRKTIANQEKIDHMAASMYAEKSGKDIAEMKSIMTKNQWMTPEEALELGLVDEIIEGDIKADINANAKMQIRMEAMQLPKLPDGFSIEDNVKRIGSVASMSFGELVTGLSTELAKIFNPKPNLKLEQETPATTNTTMNKNFVAVLALLAIEAITEVDGNLQLSAEQMKTIDDKLAEFKKMSDKLTQAETAQQTAVTAQQSAEKKVTDLETQLKEANEQIAALKAAAPAPKDVQQQEKNSPAEMSDEEAMKLAMAYMGK